MVGQIPPRLLNQLRWLGGWVNMPKTVELVDAIETVEVVEVVETVDVVETVEMVG